MSNANVKKIHKAHYDATHAGQNKKNACLHCCEVVMDLDGLKDFCKFSTRPCPAGLVPRCNGCIDAKYSCFQVGHSGPIWPSSC
jgi:hypothetical protein